MTKYCKTCAFCVRDGNYYHCIMQGRTKTERQITHTTNCGDFQQSASGLDILTGKLYKAHTHSKPTQRNLIFAGRQRGAFAHRIACWLHGLARRIEGVSNV